ncbi:MAG: MCE family protein [Tepidisphaera sp.]|nr:MCE family protein [Tepidisphaera sp.]
MFRSPLIRDFLTGLFAIGTLAGLSITLILFGARLGLGGEVYTFRVHMANGSGLAETSPVTLNGIKIGKVVRTSVATPPEIGAIVVVQVRGDVAVPRTAVVSVDKGLIGDSFIEFTIPETITKEQWADVIKKDDTFEAGNPQTMFARISTMLEKPLAKLDETAGSINRLAKTYADLGDRLTDMLEVRTAAEVDAGKAPNIRSTIARLDAALASANKWLGDDALRGQASDAVAKANRSLDQLSDLVQTWKQTGAKVDSSLDKVTQVADDAKASFHQAADQAVETLRKADEAAASLAKAIESVNQGKGTLGQLSQNPDLYNSLRSSADRLDKVLTEVQLLVEKYKAEGIPIKF